jgi:hypothetical protein
MRINQPVTSITGVIQLYKETHMAGDWIKLETNTRDKPEVLRMTAALGWDDRDFTVGKLVRAWCWFDQETVDGYLSIMSLALLDRVVGVPGFAQAMCDVGWLEQVEGGLMVPNFDRHHGHSAKNRALTAKRVAKCKAKTIETDTKASANADANAASVTSPLPREEKKREEKRKEENIKSKATSTTKTNATATAKNGDGATTTETESEKTRSTAASDDVIPPGIDSQIVIDFKALRTKLRAPITKTAIDGMQREAAKAGLTLEQAMRICCERGWRGFKAEWEQEGGTAANVTAFDALYGKPSYGKPRAEKFDPVAYVNRNRIDLS